jgi:translocation and assembly module TamA
VNRALRRLGIGAAATLVVSGLAPGPATAFDPFGLFAREEVPPPPSAEALPYRLEIVAQGGRGLVRPLQDASSLYRLRTDPPPDAEALVRRAQADLPRLLDALWGAGHYDARVVVEVAGVPLALSDGAGGAAIRAAEAYRARTHVPVRIVADPGPLFRLREVRILDGVGRPLDLPPRVAALNPGDPARSADVLAAEARIVDHFRARAHPFARVARRDPVVLHGAAAMDLTLAVEPGPRAGIGPIAVSGTQAVDPAVVRSFIYAEPGDPYSPRALAGIRRSVGRIEALASVRVREAEALDAAGNLPIGVEVTERLPRVVGFAAQYATVDGPGLRAYWTHRNLFGGAERLRIEGHGGWLGGRTPGHVRRGEGFFDELGGRLSASFLKPALGGTRNDLVADAVVARERTDGYTSRLLGATAGIRHRFDDSLWVQAAVEAERGQARDVLGAIDYRLVGLPLSAAYDSTDSPLDPTRGVRFTGGLTTYFGGLGTLGMTVARATASTYWAVTEDARTVLAARLGFGSIMGADLADIPANRRFFAGGGGSVRGFAYRSLGPAFAGQPVGGRSLFEASLEARFRITDTIGLVPFVDAGQAFASSFPDFRERLRAAVGLGLRYYTGIGPIRLDVATPVNPEGRRRPVALYVSIGQAF